MRQTGAVFNDSLAEQYYAPIVPVDHFDAILFVDSTSAARGNPRGERPPGKVLAAPRNLDFEEGERGVCPAGWEGPSRLAADHYRAEVRPEGSRPGSRSARIQSVSRAAYGETQGPLSQTVDAGPLRGKRWRLHASARVESASGDGKAFLAMRISREEGGFDKELSAPYVVIPPSAGREWREVAVEGEVPDDATRVTYRFVFEGKGSAWIDSVSLEEIPRSGP